MADQWQTYAEAAKTLGLTLEGLRQRARREGWRKTLGNDGKARVMVPIETTAPGGDAPGNLSDTKASTGRSPGKQPPVQNSGEIAALQARIEELKADLERERGERLQERDRADRMSSELTEMARELARVVQDAAARERDLHGKLDAARPSSWWPFRRVS